MPRVLTLILFLVLCLLPLPCRALDPEEVLVVANKQMSGSQRLAEYYMQKRRIPDSHLLSLSLGLSETMPRQEFDDVLVKNVRGVIEQLKSEARIAAIVLLYGVPLKVAPPLPGWDSMEKVRQFRQEKSELHQQAAAAEEDGDVEEEGFDIKDKIKNLSHQIQTLLNSSQRASVDSELALVKAGSYDLDGWQPNPYYLGFREGETKLTKDQVLLVARLDGPDTETVYRIIDDTLWAEENGLKGRAYFDARWQKPESTTGLSGYTLYDYSLHRAAEFTENRMDVVLDAKESLFPAASCPDAAIYCGWYSLAQYVDSFGWNRGAIGYHIASAECTTLKNMEKNVWCLKMLEKGAAATIGPVHEPYVQGFPMPQVFFGHLLEGYMSLGEAYLVSLPYLSWQMVLVGDPLYQPFGPDPDFFRKSKPGQ